MTADFYPALSLDQASAVENRGTPYATCRPQNTLNFKGKMSIFAHGSFPFKSDLRTKLQIRFNYRRKMSLNISALSQPHPSPALT
jgi:hypothetical protein